MTNLAATYGEYAIVTGASSGIGEEFARHLSSVGLNVVLVARRTDRLQRLAAELSDAYDTRSIVLALDLLADGAVAELHRRVAHLDIGIVAVNAAMSTTGPLVNNSLSEELAVLRLDGAVPLETVHRFGRDFARRRRGAIILVASSLEAGPTPYKANYAAAKSYVSSLGQALHYELKDHNVDVLVVSPGMTDTEGVQQAEGIDFRKIMGPRMAPSQVVSAALGQLGRRSYVVPGAPNRIGDLLVRHVLPRSVSVKAFGWMLKRAVTDTTPRWD